MNKYDGLSKDQLISEMQRLKEHEKFGLLWVNKTEAAGSGRLLV